MKNISLRVTFCFFLLVLALNVLTPVISARTYSLDSNAFPRQLRPPCVFARCAKRRSFKAGTKRAFKKVRKYMSFLIFLRRYILLLFNHFGGKIYMRDNHLLPKKRGSNTADFSCETQC